MQQLTPPYVTVIGKLSLQPINSNRYLITRTSVSYRGDSADRLLSAKTILVFWNRCCDEVHIKLLIILV